MKNVKKLTQIKTVIDEKISTNTYILKPIVILTFIHLLAISALIRADFYYNDDVQRAFSGGRMWAIAHSRYVSNYLAIILWGEKKIFDISPLTQYIAILICAIAGGVILSLFSQNKKITLVQIMAAVPLTINPFFLQCLSYKFDAPWMALSILSSVLPILFLPNEKEVNWKQYVYASFIGLLIMCNTYQASAQIYPIFILIYTYFLWRNNKVKRDYIIKTLAYSLFAYVGSLLSYYMVFVRKLFVFESAESIDSNASVYGLTDLWQGILMNLQKYLGVTLDNSNKLWIILAFGIVVAFFVDSILYSTQNKVLNGFVCAFVILFSFLLAFGPYLVLSKTKYEARMMYGVWIVITFMSIDVASHGKAYVGKIIGVYLSWCFVIFAFQYGNALAEQKRYMEYRMELIINDLNHLEMVKDNLKVSVLLDCEEGIWSPVLENMNSPAIKFIVPNAFGSFYLDYMEKYYSLDNVSMVVDTTELSGYDDTIMKDSVLVDSKFHTIMGYDDYLYVKIH